MAKTTLLSLSLSLLAVLYIASPASSAPAKPRASSFIKSSCSSTTYPQTCVESLAVFSPMIRNNDHGQLAMTSLLVSLSHARAAKAFVAKYLRAGGLRKREIGAVKDCMEELGDVEDRIEKSVKEMKSLGKKKGNGPEFELSVSNVLTWVSAAVTDENTCVDGFAGKVMDGKAKTAIRARAVKVIEVTSNALALCNMYAKKLQ